MAAGMAMATGMTAAPMARSAAGMVREVRRLVVRRLVVHRAVDRMVPADRRRASASRMAARRQVADLPRTVRVARPRVAASRMAA
jgi:hypothetical protein